MNIDPLLHQRLVCVAVIDRPDDAVPLAEALLAGGLNAIEVTFRTAGAAEAIARIRQALPNAIVGAGTLLTADQCEAGRGRRRAIWRVARPERRRFPGGARKQTAAVSRRRHADGSHARAGTRLEASEIFPGGNLWRRECAEGAAGPFGHTGVKFIPTGGITAATLPDYLALPQVAAVGGSWMAERKLVAEKSWGKITALTAEAMKLIAAAKV